MLAEPPTLIAELIRQRERFRQLPIYVMPAGSPCEYGNPEWKNHFALKCFMISFRLREAYRQGMADYVPFNLSDLPKVMAWLKPDVALIQTTPPDGQGRVNLGMAADYTVSLVRHAKLVIAEVNPQLPWVYGAGTLDENDIDVFVRAERPPYELPVGMPGPIDEQVAENVAELIPDRATIQVGIGSLGGSILRALKGKKGLGMHTGSLADEVVALVESGALTGEYKEVDEGQIVASCLIGSSRLNRFADKNDQVQLRTSDYTHHAATLARFRRFCAVNFALEIDLAGHVNAETIGTQYVSGVGGQVDFMRGAMMSREGISIIAMHATTQGGRRSRIVPEVSRSTSLKSDIHYVVTEYGIASLYGKSLRERAEALINVAHPDFRDDLRKALTEG
jgi:4-hydroxybutyrate CoA-transferase